MACVGVFWGYADQVFGKARPVDEGQEGVKGLVDSPDDHVTVWEGPEGYRRMFPQLHGQDYQDIPRGRVLFQRGTQRPLVYLDRSLNQTVWRERIARFFDFEANQATWRSDLHYTTDSEQLESLFDADEWE